MSEKFPRPQEATHQEQMRALRADVNEQGRGLDGVVVESGGKIIGNPDGVHIETPYHRMSVKEIPADGWVRNAGVQLTHVRRGIHVHVPGNTIRRGRVKEVKITTGGITDTGIRATKEKDGRTRSLDGEKARRHARSILEVVRAQAESEEVTDVTEKPNG